VKLCKVYGLDDARDADPLWQDLLEQMAPDWKARGALHRKYWEWGLGLYGLHKLGCITAEAQGLAVGAGIEWPLFYLANRVQRVVATDLYDSVHYQGLDPILPENIDRIAPFPFRRASLVFERMNALDLRFPTDTFDFAFSFSSIEHFGGHAGAALAMQEMARVLKPGGVACIATEVILDGSEHPEFFHPHEIDPWFVEASGLEMVEPLDLHIDEPLITNPVPFDYPPGFQGDTGPHTSVRIGGVTFTSIEFFLRKPRGWKPASERVRRDYYTQMRVWLGLEQARRSIFRRVFRKARKLLSRS
jgi:SAM-dependent methyltransferase